MLAREGGAVMRSIVGALVVVVVAVSTIWLLYFAARAADQAARAGHRGTVLHIHAHANVAREEELSGGVPDVGPAPDASGVECITREWCPSYRGCCRRGEHLYRQPCAEVPSCE